MQKIKIVFALAAIAALTLAAVGLAAAQIIQNQTLTGTEASPNGAVPNQGFWGWIGRCFGYRAAEPYEGQYVAPPAAVTNGTVPQLAPYQPYQGGYGYNNGYGYGYGPCWARW